MSWSQTTPPGPRTRGCGFLLPGCTSDQFDACCVCSAVVPLTVENVVGALKGGESWRWKGLGGWLGVPHLKLDDIQRKFSSNKECMVSLTQWWMKTHPSPSWRRVLFALDQMSGGVQTRVVDEIHHYAEPLTGKHVEGYTINRELLGLHTES